MMNGFREAEARVVLVSPTWGKQDFGEITAIHDYVGQLKKEYPDVVYSFWVSPAPGVNIIKWIRELERCIKDLGSAGVYYNGFSTGIPANDKYLYPFYDLCQEAGVPIKISVGHTAAGAGMPGGTGIHLRTENPIYIDDVAADFPSLKIIATHCPWPYHNEMISIMLHKANVYNDLHGWLPRYFPPEIKREINGRLKQRFLFGSDFPFFAFQRLYDDWESQDYKPEALENVFYRNAQRVFGVE
jgi:predicted TIM-barrel fold metal-dependent hydrolase